MSRGKLVLGIGQKPLMFVTKNTYNKMYFSGSLKFNTHMLHRHCIQNAVINSN